MTNHKGNTIHYHLHGYHHKHPMDGLRLTFPLAPATILCVENHATMVIRIIEEKQEEYAHILRGSVVCLHPRERRHELFTITK